MQLRNCNVHSRDNIINFKSNLYMKRLLLKYSCSSDMAYYELMVNCFENGNLTKCASMFRDLQRGNKKLFISLMKPKSNWGISHITKEGLFNFCSNLI
jgi:hypothetical protein